MQAETHSGLGARSLLAVDPCCLGPVGSGIANNLQQLYRQGQFHQALSLADAVTDYLDRVAQPETLTLDWVDRVADVIADAYHSQRNQLSPLYLPQQMTMYQTSGSGGTFQFHTRFSSRPGRPPVVQHYRSPGMKPVRNDTPMAAQRRQCHNGLCRSMLAIPQLAEAGFSRLAAEARARNGLTAAHVEMARTALLTGSPPPASVSGAPGRPPTSGLFWNKLQCPAEFLVQQAGQTDSLDRLRHEFVPELQRQGQSEQAERLQRLIDGYHAIPPGNMPAWGRAYGQVPVSHSRSTPTKSTTVTRDPNRIRQRLEASRSRRVRRSSTRR
jgi:hypothetical protein